MALTNEMNMPIISAAALGVTGDVTAAMSGSAVDRTDYDYDDMTIGMPCSELEASAVTVYATSITPVSYDANDGPVVAFDIVFSVGVNCGDSTKTYQVVRRIGVDKVKLATTAQSTTPVSIVEAKNALSKDADETRKRFRRLAGLD